MEDRELLEYAAKAAGLRIVLRDAHDAWIGSDGCKGGIRWNPLEDDGDALRLAVKLGLDVFSRPAQWCECGRIGQVSMRETYRGDPYAATRRAIVRAAAAIGESL